MLQKSPQLLRSPPAGGLHPLSLSQKQSGAQGREWAQDTYDIFDEKGGLMGLLGRWTGWSH